MSIEEDDDLPLVTHPSMIPKNPVEEERKVLAQIDAEELKKKTALEQIAHHVEVANKALEEAKRLAIASNGSFHFVIGGGAQDDYRTTSVGGRYDATYVGQDGESTEGYWYWDNSSLNC